jgi:hypothetical protein
MRTLFPRLLVALPAFKETMKALPGPGASGTGPSRCGWVRLEFWSLCRLNCKVATQPLKPESNETNIQWQDYLCHRDSSPSGGLRESSKSANTPIGTIPMDSDKSFAVAIYATFFRQSMTRLLRQASASSHK